MAEKQSQESVDYVRRSRKVGEFCGICTMWRPPKSCSAVVGPIDRQGWCKIFERFFPSKPKGGAR